MMEVDRRFRQWTRGVSFTLAMGRRQVSLLIAIHASQRRRSMVGEHHRMYGSFPSAMRALKERGLVIERHYERPEPASLHVLMRRKALQVSTLYRVTEIGEHVVELLRAAGVYGELLQEMREADSQWRSAWARGEFPVKRVGNMR